MNPDQWARVKVLFQGALERPPSEREAWLRAAAGSDVEALREAWALLDAHDTSGLSKKSLWVHLPCANARMHHKHAVAHMKFDPNNMPDLDKL